MCANFERTGLLAEFSNSAEKKFPIRTVVIATLAGLSFLLSFLFIVSPEASLQTGAQPEAEVPQGPQVQKQDFKLAGNQTFYSIMSGLGVSGPEIQDIALKARPVYDLRQLRMDSVLTVSTLEDSLKKIEYKFSPYEYLIIEKTPEGEIIATKDDLPHEIRETVIAGTIENSFYEDAIKAGADAQSVVALTDIFAWDIDFASDIRKGDSFNILAEALYVEGVPVKTSRIQGAEMVNGGKKYTAIYYEGKSGNGYYNAEGKSLRRSLLKSPLRFRRISSHFSKNRFHPVLKRYRAHHGVDYAAPTGTPVEAAGSGVVRIAGRKGGFGNLVEIRHNSGYVTRYAHLSKIRKGIRAGAKVDQGDVVGYVGSTGISSGPHLHYEVRVNNRLVNPLSIKSVADRAISKKELNAFAAIKGQVEARLATGHGTALAQNRDAEHPVSD